MSGFDATHDELHALSPEAATRCRVAMHAAEWALSDGYSESFEKWGIEPRGSRLWFAAADGISGMETKAVPG
jgi:hypothetical protein